MAKHPVPRGRRRRLAQSAAIAAAAVVALIAGLGPAAQPATAASAGRAMAIPVPGPGGQAIPRSHLPAGLHNVPGLPAVPGLPSTPVKFRHVCPRPTASRPSCFALLRTDTKPVAGRLAGTCAANGGYGPADLASAYNLPAGNGAGQTVAVVDAFDDPNAESDLANYRADCGLPPCTTANHCFIKVNQNGGTDSYPAADPAWSLEITLDLDMVSAACPNCDITLVEANTNDWDNLDIAEDTAASLAPYVSNSFGSPETAASSSRDPHFDHPGVAIEVAAGDSGYGVFYPASSPTVTAVGGTSLLPAQNARGWDEIVWGKTGSGCSQYEPKPSWQRDTGCPSNRMNNDIAADADPDTGVAIYDTYGPLLVKGWNMEGGTSASTPFIAGVFALAGPPTDGTVPASYLYTPKPGTINDIVAGTNYPFGSCVPRYFCNAVRSYDGPTGWGTPWGIASFAPPGSAARR